MSQPELTGELIFPAITAVVLAGGRGRRMGGQDKGLLTYQGRLLVEYPLTVLQGLAAKVYLNANRNLEEYAKLGFPLLPDQTQAFDGPLAGLLSAMLAADTPYILTAPCDCPKLQPELFQRLWAKLDAEQAELCAPIDGTRMHPVFLLGKTDLREDLADYLARGERKVETWLKSHRLVLADCSDHPEWFININTPEDLQVG